MSNLKLGLLFKFYYSLIFEDTLVNENLNRVYNITNIRYICFYFIDKS